jgi:hypothetical protein
VPRPVAIALAVVLLAVGNPVALRAASFGDVSSLGLDASYDVVATFDWHARTADVRTTATVIGSKPWPTSVLAFNLQILRIGDAKVGVVNVDGRPVDATVEDQTIYVPLDPPLAPTGTTAVEIDYTAHMSASPDPNGDDWGFAATSQYLTAYRWIPWLSRTTKFDRPSVGDPYVTANASSVHVDITADPSLIFAATGIEMTSATGAHSYEVHNVRDFNFVASPTYQVARRNVRGIDVSFYYDRLDPGTVLDATTRAINDYSDKVGSYPYPVLNIAETGPWASIESPQTFWLADNVPGHLLAWTTAHEVAHEWFYAVVGNDQAREPFADEALADFMARNLLDDFVPSQCPTGFLDATIYDLGTCYPWVVYVQGNLWLREMRDRIGAAAFWGAIASYYAANTFGIGGTRKLLDALDVAAGGAQLHPQFPRLYALPVPDLPFGGATLGLSD